MRFRDSIISVVTLVLGLITVTGMAYTDQFPQAVKAESVGFDALAHQVFSTAQEDQTDQVAEQ